MDKDVFMCNGVLLSHKKYELLPFVTTWMEPEGKKGWRQGEMDKGGQLYGDGWKLDFW